MTPKRSIARTIGRWVLLTMGAASVVVLPMLWICRGEVEEAYQRDRHRRLAANVDSFGSHLIDIDRVELLRLDDEPVKQDSRTYTIPLLEPRVMNVAREHILIGEEAKAFAALWRRQEVVPGSYVGCHEPHHVLRFFAGQSLVVDIVICFRCCNVALPVFPGHELATIVSPPELLKKLQTNCEIHVGAAAEW